MQHADGEHLKTDAVPVEELLNKYPELKVLQELSHLTVLLSAPDFPERSKLACLSSLASLSKIKGLESLKELEVLDQLSERDVGHIF